MFVSASLCKHREQNQLDATEWFIALIICSTCFGHLHAHHQEHETIRGLLEKYPTFGREKETGLLGALDT